MSTTPATVQIVLKTDRILVGTSTVCSRLQVTDKFSPSQIMLVVVVIVGPEYMSLILEKIQTCYKNVDMSLLGQ